MLKQFSNF